MTIPKSRSFNRSLQAFLLAFVIAVLVFLPAVIFDGGYFIYFGDFNVQQIPFYQLAHEAVRSGDIWWNWYTDLGANFVGSYSFYLLFSPFFWITLLFPTSAVPLLMAPLLVLKIAFSALTACLFLERFVKDRAWAVVGSLFYAFSGWMFFNIFFNHFLDVAVFFPLLLLGVELLVCEKKVGFFAAMVAVNAAVNYWFFIGEAVFILIYVAVRSTDRQWRMNWATFFKIAIEAIIGMGLATVVMLPAILAISGNPRTGLDELATGWNFWLYWHEQRQPAILQSLFFPPEVQSRPNFFPDHGAKWSSLSGWIPFFGMTGVIAYFFAHKDDWLKKILALSLVIALIPGFNSIFILLNNSYYARWFFMPILLMSLATIRAIEDSAQTSEFFVRSIKWCLIIVLTFLVMSGLTPNKKNDTWKFGMANDLTLLWVYGIIAIISLILVFVLIVYLRHSKGFMRMTTAAIAVICVGFGVLYIFNGKNDYERSQLVINSAIGGRDNISLPDDKFARSDFYDAMDNQGMFWHLPNIQAFHSIVPVSIMDFYPTVGVKRDVGSRPEASFFALRPLLSVRWLFIGREKDEQEPMAGYTFYGEQIAFNIYENDNYLPMGICYDSYLTRAQLENVEEKFRSNIMLRAIVLENSDAYYHEDILEIFDTERPLSFSVKDMVEDVAKLKPNTADDFSFDNKGFTSHTSNESENIFFYSVPWDKGWSATINGEPSEILKVNVGFMGVRVPAGANEIRFEYETPGLFLGLKISLAFLLLFVVYVLIAMAKNRENKKDLLMQKRIFAENTQIMSWEEFFNTHMDQKNKAINLQRILNDASRKSFPQELPNDQKTLDWEDDSEENTKEVE